MRTIKFRAKRLDNNDWVYGGTLINFLDDEERTFYMPSKKDRCTTSEDSFGNIKGFKKGTFYKVVNETLGQFTGLLDKNGKEIYEGDILGGIWFPSTIKWCDKCGSFEIFDENGVCYCCSGDVIWKDIVSCDDLEVIGNIHDNKELLDE